MTPVVIFAGGFGLRLGSVARKVPKPLLPVGSKPILETIIDTFAAQGFRRIWLCLHYKADQIEAHFGDGSSKGLRIKYIREEEPLGTGGALHLIPDFDKPFIVSNADWIIQPAMQFGRLMEAHARANVMATVCAGLYQHQVPFGVIDVSELKQLKRMREKPIENFWVNAGIYVLNPEVRNYAPEGRFDLPSLIDGLVEGGESVGVYPIEGQWADLGSFESLAGNHLVKTIAERP